jgi:hypothetical protein
MIQRIKKRDGLIVNFGPEKIAKQSLESIPCAKDVPDILLDILSFMIVERALINEGSSKEAEA